MSDTAAITITDDASLAARNTFRVPARARRLLEIHADAALADTRVVEALGARDLFILGAGSNVLFTRDWPGDVLVVATRGIGIVHEDASGVIVRAAAGENWNKLVQWTLDNGLCGIENLVLIPGTVGAAPIQNIGAYGVELAECVDSVQVFDRTENRLRTLSNAECEFAYRDSVFKRSPHRYLVLALDVTLQRSARLRIDYAGIADELSALGVANPTPRTVAEAVSRLRLRKLPNPAVIGNAGSFFKNPVVDASAADRLRARHLGMPAWELGPNRKLSAAWLIESCGFKGLREGSVGVSSQHALVLVNFGDATGAQIWALAQRVMAGVAEKFGVHLEPEPTIL